MVSGTVDLSKVSDRCDPVAGLDHPGIVQPVEKVLVHPLNDAATNSYDFALLRLPELSPNCRGYANRRPMRLPLDTDAQWINKPYTAMTIAGWGRKAEGGYISQTLQKVVVPLVDRETCGKTFANIGERIYDEMLCAGYQTGGFDSCQGDSGGPMFFQPHPKYAIAQPVRHSVLAGVVSWGRGCARGTGMFGIYARVVYGVDWIEKAILNNL